MIYFTTIWSLFKVTLFFNWISFSGPGLPSSSRVKKKAESKRAASDKSGEMICEFFLDEPNFVILDKTTSFLENTTKRRRNQGKQVSQGLSILLALLEAIVLDSEQDDSGVNISQAKAAGSDVLSILAAEQSKGAAISDDEIRATIQNTVEGEMVKDFLLIFLSVEVPQVEVPLQKVILR